MAERCSEGCRSGQMGDGHLYCPPEETPRERAIRRNLPVREWGYRAVQYPTDVCDSHEYGSEWPCLGCGK